MKNTKKYEKVENLKKQFKKPSKSKKTTQK